jgi:hypothetical protein
MTDRDAILALQAWLQSLGGRDSDRYAAALTDLLAERDDIEAKAVALFWACEGDAALKDMQELRSRAERLQKAEASVSDLEAEREELRKIVVHDGEVIASNNVSALDRATIIAKQAGLLDAARKINADLEARVSELQAERDRLDVNLRTRDAYIVEKDLWQDFVTQLPNLKPLEPAS